MESGKFVLRIDATQHRTLKEEARNRGISLNQICIERLAGPESKRSEESIWIVPVLRAFKARDILGVLLYGSQARNQATAGSDIDLMIVLGLGSSPTRRDYSVWDEQVAEKVPKQINPSFVEFVPNQTPSGLWLEVALDGVILWQRDETLQSHLANLRFRIAGGEFRRRFVHGQPQWIQQQGSE